jgi:ABC-type transporter Mla maintaining outer membrane lipid asymmetry ATPase subunit MlaF
MPEVEISIKGLTKSFGPQTVLEDITCDIPKGKITLMLGPSGTGKSVFLKHLDQPLDELRLDQHRPGRRTDA